ncbi:peptide/nickel transport system permease protein [Frankia sp. AiPs1]|uniref:ABC transporter permease n=1 Tax=Frankia sp. AiPa1 TaxID=573492 RepID=UPI00202ADAE3|nr:ABC transporter permease [Frankia sp. AiPa1]MCL9760920.1 ABC transporter permease [Frankia sp. AiPa1]
MTTLQIDPAAGLARPSTRAVAIRAAVLRAATTRGAGRGLVRLLRTTLLVWVPVVLVSTFITFGLGALTDTNPAAQVLGETATPADIARMNHYFGLDRPFLVQYVSWLGHALTGDLGRSYYTTLPVRDSITQALPVNISITIVALVLAILIGGVLGIGAALSGGGWFDRGVTMLCSAASTVPPFVIGIALIVIFSVTLPILPSGGYVAFDQDFGQWLRFAILPSLALAVEAAVAIARQLRTSLVGELRENYVTGADVRGLSRRRVVFGHALRNAAGPTVTIVGYYVPQIIGAMVVAEAVFNLPGLGKLSLDAASKGDIPLIQGVLVTMIGLVVVSNLVVNAVLLRLTPHARKREQ